MNQRKVGSQYEILAAEYLTENGMKVVETNFRNRQGEIDIIGYHKGYLVFTEVKYRKTQVAGHPVEAVTWAKQRKICMVADFYRYRHRISDQMPIRYDVIAILKDNIEWYKMHFTISHKGVFMNMNEIVTQTFDINYKDEAEYLTFPAFTNSGLVRHLFSTRTGGYSEGIFASMNLGLNRGDARENVIKNFDKIADILNCSIEEFVFSDQTHLDQVRVITKEDAGKGITRKRDFFDTDGMITNEPGVILATFYADCVPLYFLDPVNKAIGLTHSGWRGTVKQIGKKTVEAMKKNFGTEPANLIAGIGPSICENCYEVGAEVALEFKKIFPNDYHEVVKTNESGNFQLNLWEANRKILLLSGILERNISVTDLCTCCHSEYLFSHRATNGKRGNLGAFLGLL